jgi:cobalt-zinc-cadmium efflux system outer membrane protein
MKINWKPRSSHGTGFILLSFGGLLAGCASVNPSSDYDRAQVYVAEATQADSGSLGMAVEDTLVFGQIEHRMADGLTIEEAVDIALLNNKELKAGLYEIGISRAELVQSGLLANPSLGAVLRYPDGGGDPTVEGRLAFNLIDLWHRPARKRVSEFHLERTILEAAHEASQVSARTKTAYVATVAAQLKRKIEQLNLEATDEFLKLSLARQNAGAASVAETNTARAENLEQAAILRSAELFEVETKLRLASLLGLETGPDELTVVDPLTPHPELDLDLVSLTAIADAHRLDLWAAKENVRAMEAAVSLQKRLVLPTLEGSIELEGRGSEYEVGPGLDLELPLFDQNQAQVSIAEMRRQQADASFENLRLSAHQQVRAALVRLTTTFQTARSYEEEILPLRESSLDLARRSFTAGKTGFLNVLAAQRQLISARREAASWAESSALMVFSLEAACGRPLKDLMGDQEPVGELPGGESSR